MKKIISVSLLSLLLLSLSACSKEKTPEQPLEQPASNQDITQIETPTIEEAQEEGKILRNVEKVVMRIEDPGQILDEDAIAEYDYEAFLSDVRGDGGNGIAFTKFDGSFVLESVLVDLPEPKEGFFYEAWIVRDEPVSVVSTGKVERFEEFYVNSFFSDEDLTDHEFYFISLEAEDDDPRSGDHVLEGIFNPFSN